MNTEQFFALHDELRTADQLVRLGFGELQEIGPGNDFYHLPHQLLASGLERLMKCYIAIVEWGRNGSLPTKADFQKRFGHDLEALKNTITTDYFGGLDHPLIAPDYDFLTTDVHLAEALRILSLFGKRGRYHYLDVVGGDDSSPNPNEEWQQFEETVEAPVAFAMSFGGDFMRADKEYHPRVTQKIVAVLERFMRAITRQLAFGHHADADGKVKQASTYTHDYLFIDDDQLGTKDYRRTTAALKREQATWEKFDVESVLQGPWPARRLRPDDVSGEWPFRVDEVVVELRENLFAVLYAESYAFSLDNAATMKFDYPRPHDADVAVLGKSTHAVLEAANAMQQPKPTQRRPR